MHHSESIIMSKIPFREADLLVTFFSREGGKLKGVAKNARRSKKRFGGTLETGYLVDLHYRETSSSTLATIDQALLISPKMYSGSSLASSSALWLAIELASKFLPDGEVNPEKFELLKRFIVAVHEGRLSRPVLIFFVIKWIGLSGYLPDFDSYRQLKNESLDVLKRVVSGDMKCVIKDDVFEDILQFIFNYTLSLLGRPLEVASYGQMLMEIQA